MCKTGQDGGLVSAMLIWLLENDIIDGALTSGWGVENGEPGWKAFPMVATNRDEVLRGAAAVHLLGQHDGVRRGQGTRARTARPRRHELPDLGCAGDVASQDRQGLQAVQAQHRTSVRSRSTMRCSTNSSRSSKPQAREHREDEHLGVFQVWTKDGYHEINLKECHAWTREAQPCFDFAAEHADISTGIGNETDWTLTLVRTELGRAVIDAAVKDGAIETRPATMTRAPSR